MNTTMAVQPQNLSIILDEMQNTKAENDDMNRRVWFNSPKKHSTKKIKIIEKNKQTRNDMGNSSVSNVSQWSQ